MSHDLFYPTDAERAAAALTAYPGYRVLRQVPPVDLLPLTAPVGPVRRAAILDVETTGLDTGRDRIIELAVLVVTLDARGRLVDVDQPVSWLEDPGAPLGADVQRVTGLADADLVGNFIDTEAATAMLAGVDVLVAHNASFDAAFVERRLPGVVGRPWACSCIEIDWAGLGYEGAKLGHLLMQQGWFHVAHRATADVVALATLLSHVAQDGDTLFSKLLNRAARPTIRVEATGAPFRAKDDLKARRYRWNAQRRVWWREIEECNLATEHAWLSEVGFCPDPQLQLVTWRERHRPPN